MNKKCDDQELSPGEATTCRQIKALNLQNGVWDELDETFFENFNIVNAWTGFNMCAYREDVYDLFRVTWSAGT